MKRLLLHACCAPCSTSALEKLSGYFDGDITLFFYNPNIAPAEEMQKRLDELVLFSDKVYGDKAPVIVGEYDANDWLKLIGPLASTGEGGERCRLCYYLRLLKTFERAKELGFTHVSTTLSVSPYKNFEWLTDIGNTLAKHFGIEYIAEKWDYKRSKELSNQYGLYRQNYCGCVFSKPLR